MKTLYVGYYDFPYGYHAYMLAASFIDVEFSWEDATNFYWMINDSMSKEEEQECYNKLSPHLKKYNTAIVCTDGIYETIDLDKYKENK